MLAACTPRAPRICGSPGCAQTLAAWALRTGPARARSRRALAPSPVTAAARPKQAPVDGRLADDGDATPFQLAGERLSELLADVG
jgi:hypothetical protein